MFKRDSFIAWFVLVVCLIVLVVLSNVGCAVCTAQATRCTGNITEICDSRGHWRTLMDCDEVQGDLLFACQETIDEGEEAHTCLPTPEDGEGELE
jgi:hypothetical protein